jgi:hypothetical protein
MARFGRPQDPSIEEARTLRAEARLLRERFRLAVRRWRDAGQRLALEGPDRDGSDRPSSLGRRLEKG